MVRVVYPAPDTSAKLIAIEADDLSGKPADRAGVPIAFGLGRPLRLDPDAVGRAPRSGRCGLGLGFGDRGNQSKRNKDVDRGGDGQRDSEPILTRTHRSDIHGATSIGRSG